MNIRYTGIVKAGLLVSILIIIMILVNNINIYYNSKSSDSIDLSDMSVAVVCSDCESIERVLRGFGLRNIAVINRVYGDLVRDFGALFILDDSLAKIYERDVSDYLVRGGVVIALRDVYLDTLKDILSSRGTIFPVIHNTTAYIVRFFGFEEHLSRNLTAVVGVSLKNLESRDGMIELLKWVKRAKLYETQVIRIGRIVISENATTPEIKITINSTPPTSTTPKILTLRPEPGVYDLSWVVIGYVSWTSGDSWKPYGKLSIEHAIYRLIEDPYPDIDWFIVKAVTEGVPGKVVWGEESYLEDLWNYYYLKYYTSIYELRDYDPSSYVNPVTVSVELGTDVAAIVSWTYPGNYINRIDCYSDFHLDRAAWWHDIAGAGVTIKIEPGFEFTVSPVQTGMQRWEISAQWILNQWWGLIKQPFKGVLIVELTLYY